MPYLIFRANGVELDRRDLAGSRPLVVGRAEECDVPIRDVVLSRRHCAVERTHHGWVVTDLGSRNGTHVGEKPVREYVLRDGDELRIGRTRMTFVAAAFAPALPGSPAKRDRVVRPADPAEALAGTLAGFELVPADEVRYEANRPVPRPRPPEPRALRSAPVQSMLDEIISGTWETARAHGPRQVELPHATALQARPEDAAEREPQRRRIARPALPPRPGRRWHLAGAIPLVLTIVLLLATVGAWVLAVSVTRLRPASAATSATGYDSATPTARLHP